MLQAGLLQVSYGAIKVDDGNELTPTQVKDPPTVSWAADDGSYYLLCMTGTQTTLGDPTAMFHKSAHHIVHRPVS
jgi:hypothetical protein